MEASANPLDSIVMLSCGGHGGTGSAGGSGGNGGDCSVVLGPNGSHDQVHIGQLGSNGKPGTAGQNGSNGQPGTPGRIAISRQLEGPVGQHGAPSRDKVLTNQAPAIDDLLSQQRQK
jgi:hypothetical protein